MAWCDDHRDSVCILCTSTRNSHCSIGQVIPSGERHNEVIVARLLNETYDWLSHDFDVTPGISPGRKRRFCRPNSTVRQCVITLKGKCPCFQVHMLRTVLTCSWRSLHISASLCWSVVWSHPWLASSFHTLDTRCQWRSAVPDSGHTPCGNTTRWRRCQFCNDIWSMLLVAFCWILQRPWNFLKVSKRSRNNIAPRLHTTSAINNVGAPKSRQESQWLNNILGRNY